MVHLKKINELLNQKIYNPIFNSELPSDLLNQWEKNDLITPLHKNIQYSTIDIIWMSLLKELEELNISKLLEIKKSLFETILLSNQITHFTMQTIVYATPVFLVIPKEQQPFFYTDIQYLDALQKGKLTNHKTISLNQQIKENFSELYQRPIFNMSAGLSTNEKRILELLRNRKYQTVTISKKEGIIDRIESSERIGKIENLITALKQHDYQDIEIKKANGKIVLIKRTLKIKPTKEISSH